MNLTKATRCFLMLKRYKTFDSISRNNINFKQNLLYQDNCTLRFLSSSNLSEDERSVKKSVNSADLLTFLKSDVTISIEENSVINFIQHCGHLSFKKSLSERSNLLDSLWKKFHLNKINLTSEIYNAYIQTCIDNSIGIKPSTFLSELKLNPTTEIFHLLLKCVCEKGNISDAMEILSAMKDKDIPVTEETFNYLIMGHIINGGSEAAKPVFQTMKTAQIPTSPETDWLILKALAKRSDKTEFLKKLNNIPKTELKEEKFYEILWTLGYHGNYLWATKFISHIGINRIPQNSAHQLNKVCIHLIHSNRPEAAMSYYKDLVEPTIEGHFATHLLKEMLITKTPISIVISEAKELISQSLNLNALLEVTDMTLRMKLVDESLEIFKELEFLRSHFFWPLITTRGEEKGEIGVLEILQRMKKHDVQTDFETLVTYGFRYCDLSDLKRFLHSLDFGNMDIITPLVAYLLISKEVKKAEQLSVEYSNFLIADKLSKPLISAWRNTKESKPLTKILQKMCEKNLTDIDWVGIFLLNILKTCRHSTDFDQYYNLVKLVKTSGLKISSSFTEQILLRLTNSDCQNKNEISTVIDSLLDIAKVEVTDILNPKDMNLNELECHLIELTEKNMETRGVIRKLIQAHMRVGNVKRVEELSKLLIDSGYEDTPALRSALLQVYTKQQNLEEALNIYDDIKKRFPTFMIDDYKIVDLCSLLVKNGKFNEAVNLLEAEAKWNRKPNSTMSRNCWSLIGSTNSLEDGYKILEILTKNSYVLPNNVILGPLVRMHMKQNNVDKVVEVYCDFTKKYRCTPLQLEVLCLCVKSKNEKLLQKLLDANAAIHGDVSTKMMLIYALAECELVGALSKVLINTKVINNGMIKKKCERWVNENKLPALLTLLKAADRLSNEVIDLSIVRLAILRLHSSRNDCESALGFWRELQDEDKFIPTDFQNILLTLLIRCKHAIPNELNQAIETNKLIN